jgi:hypothetical protein
MFFMDRKEWLMSGFEKRTRGCIVAALVLPGAGTAVNGLQQQSCYTMLRIFACSKWTRLSRHDFDDNQVRPQLFALAQYTGDFLRRLALPK